MKENQLKQIVIVCSVGDKMDKREITINARKLLSQKKKIVVEPKPILGKPMLIKIELPTIEYKSRVISDRKKQKVKLLRLEREKKNESTKNQRSN